MSQGRPVLKPHPDVIAQRMGEVLLLLHLRTNRFFELNRTGARLWELLAEGKDRGQLHDCLSAEFDVAPAQLDAEIDSVLATLRAEQLVSGDAEA